MNGNPLMIRRKRREPIDVILHDWDQPEGAQRYELRLFRLTGNDVLRAQSLWEELVQIYVIGGTPLPPVDDQPVIVSSGACQLAAYLYTAQRETEPKDGGYTVEMLFAMMTSDALLAQMQQVFSAILPLPTVEQKGEDGEKKQGLVFVDPLLSGATPPSAFAPETS